MKNPRTTIAGYLVIAGALAYGVAHFLSTGTIDAETLKAVVTAVAGTGLVAGADGGH